MFCQILLHFAENRARFLPCRYKKPIIRHRAGRSLLADQLNLDQCGLLAHTPLSRIFARIHERNYIMEISLLSSQTKSMRSFRRAHVCSWKRDVACDEKSPPQWNAWMGFANACERCRGVCEDAFCNCTFGNFRSTVNCTHIIKARKAGGIIKIPIVALLNYVDGNWLFTNDWLFLHRSHKQLAFNVEITVAFDAAVTQFTCYCITFILTKTQLWDCCK